jgi:hypothetical protein
MKTTKLKSVYLVTDGCYPDYHIIAVFSSKRKANKFLHHIVKNETELWTLDNPRIEKHILDKQMDYVNSGYKVYTIQMDYATGNILTTTEIYSIPKLWIQEDVYERYAVPNTYYLWGPSDEPVKISIAVKSKDQEHAIKIASDVRRQVYSENPTLKTKSGKF